MNFGGFVVGDWNGHGQVKGCTTDCRPPSSRAWTWRWLRTAGRASTRRRWLRSRTAGSRRSGWTMSAPDPAGQVPPWAVRGRQAIHAGRRRAVRTDWRAGTSRGRPAGRARIAGPVENQDHVLPLSPKQRILVAGDGANDVGKQAGGWTLNWQHRHHPQGLPNADTIYEGIARARPARPVVKPCLPLTVAMQ